MTTAWRRYQDDVAELFRSLGLLVSTEAEVEGARARHRIDVLVTFELWGVKVLWIVECKFWRARVPKEKVLASIRSLRMSALIAPFCSPNAASNLERWPRREAPTSP